MFDLDPSETAILYWWATGVPIDELASLSGESLERLRDQADQLAKRLSILPQDLSERGIDFAQGLPLRIGYPHAERTMARLVADKLGSRDDEEIFLHVAGQGAMTVGEFREVVARIRSGFRAAGVRPRDRIAADATLTIENYLLTCAAWLHGVAIVRLDSRAAVLAMRSMLDITSPRLTFTARAAELGDGQSPGHLVALGDEAGQSFLTFDDWLANAPEPTVEDLAVPEVDPFDVCVIASTSGSTGRPKAVLLSNLSIWLNGERATRFGRFDANSVFCSATDLSSNISTYITISLPLFTGGTAVVPSTRALGSPIAFALDCIEAGVTCAMVVPSALRTILAADEELARSWAAGLRQLFSGTAPMGEPLAREFRRLSGASIIESLGAREVGGFVIAVTKGTQVLAAGGGVNAEVLVRVVNESGETAATEESGELLLVSAAIMNGYAGEHGNEPNAYAHLPPRPQGYELWYSTGDVACYTQSGGIRLLGRKRDIIKAPDGRIVMPIEIEDVLHADKDVREACAFSVIDDSGSEIIGAAVVPGGSSPADELETRLRRTILEELGPIRTPAGILVVHDFPRVGRGKIDKEAVRVRFREEKMANPGLPTSHEQAGGT